MNDMPPMMRPGPGLSHRADDAGHDGTDCSEALLRVFEFLDGEMGPGDRAKIAAHLDACSRCLTQYNLDTTLKALIRRSCSGEEAPVTLRMSIMTQITMSLVPLDSPVRDSRERF